MVGAKALRRVSVGKPGLAGISCTFLLFQMAFHLVGVYSSLSLT
jgi:hypothetical protein